MQDQIRGRVIRLAFDDVSTDIITPGEFRGKVDDSDEKLSTLRPHVFRAIRPGIDAIVKPGDVFVVGRNFGCGSHREPAVQIFKIWGVQAVVTESAARAGAIAMYVANAAATASAAPLPSGLGARGSGLGRQESDKLGRFPSPESRAPSPD